MKHFVILIIINCFFQLQVSAQPLLPDVAVMTQGGLNVLSWTNPYEKGVKAVVIERSFDSLLNYTEIGNVLDISKQLQYYLDAFPLAGNNYYQVKVVFNSGLEWKSKVTSIFVDSTELEHRKVLPPNDSLQKLVAKMGSLPSENQLNQIGYSPSPYVFTNPYNGNINIELTDALEVNYKLIFYDQQDREVLEIPRINDQSVILDKRNFQRSGLYKFKLFKGKEKYADGMVNVFY